MAYQPKSYRKFLAGSVSAAVVASALVAPAASAASADFPDVPKGHWAYDAISTLTAKDIINGYTDGSFKPSQLLNRGQAAALFTNALGLEIPEKLDTFKDLKSTSYFAQYAAAVEAAGVFGGYADGNFGAGDNLTREQMASVLVRAFDFKATGDSVDLIDLDKAHASHRENIKILAQNGISVNEDKTFDPKDPVSRAHFATFLYRSMVATGMLAENPAVESVKAINATTVEVKMVEEVKDVKALKFSIDGLEVKNAAVKQTDSKTVVLTTAAQEGGKKYTVSLNGEKLGSFDGISAVIPTSIEVETTSVQGKVGNEVTLKADIGVKVANVPVTFNVDAKDDLNKNQVVEVYTNADGIAEYSYTQYADGQDWVAVYPTGAPQVRDFATVYWGVNDILTLDTDSDATLANGEEKTYKVTLLHPETGKPVSGAKLNVTFLENLEVKPSDVKKAVVGDPSTGRAETPYQTTDGEENAVFVETDSKGVATFTVSGTNTAVTPIVFVDGSSALDDKGDNDRLDVSELQTIGNKVTFKGAQETNKFGVVGEDLTVSLGLVSDKDEAAAGDTNGRKYTVSVTDKDGKAYSGGVVNVALNEDIDGLRSTNTTAVIGEHPDGDSLLGDILAGTNDAEIQVKLDKDGKAEFFVFGNDDEVATPIVWIDQNNAQNTQAGVLEVGEPQFVAETTNFEDARVVGAVLSIDGEDETKVTLDGNEDASVEFTPVNQSGNFIDVDYDVTYVVKNTGSKPVTVEAAGYEDGEGNALGTEVIEVGGTLTLHNNAATGVDTFDLTSDGGSVSVRATGVTEDDLSADKRENNLRLVPKQVLTIDFGTSTDLKNGVVYQGTVEEVKAASNQIVLNIDGNEHTLTYNVSDKLYIAGEVATLADFERALEEDITVEYVKEGDVESFDIIDNVDPEAVTNLAFTDTDTDADEIAGEITFTASTSADVVSTVVALNGTEIVPNVAGTYVIAADTPIATPITVTVTDDAGNTAVSTLEVVDVIPVP